MTLWYPPQTVETRAGFPATCNAAGREGWCAGALLLGGEDTRRDSVTDLPDVRPRNVSTRPVALW